MPKKCSAPWRKYKMLTMEYANMNLRSTVYTQTILIGRYQQIKFSRYLKEAM